MDYTPTTDEVRNHYSDKWDYYFDKPAEVSEVRKREAAFDRWLAARDRGVAARAVKTIAALHVRRGRPSMSECSCGEIICPTLRAIERLVEPNA